VNLPDFITSWGLFALPYSLTLVAASVLAILGVATASRRQVFMAAAVTQSSVFGFALFSLLFGASASGLSVGAGQGAIVVCFAIAAALVTMLGGGAPSRGDRLDHDERTAWVFIAAGVGATLVLSHAPAGMEQVRRLQASSVVGAEWSDVVLFAALLAALAWALFRYGNELVLLLTDSVMASAIGMRVGAWNLCIALLCGASIGMSVRATGMVFTFGCLALPVMIAKQFCGEVRALFWVSPLIAALCGACGLWAAYEWNLPLGQAVVAALSVALAIAVGLRRGWNASIG